MFSSILSFHFFVLYLNSTKILIFMWSRLRDHNYTVVTHFTNRINCHDSILYEAVEWWILTQQLINQVDDSIHWINEISLYNQCCISFGDIPWACLQTNDCAHSYNHIVCMFSSGPSRYTVLCNRHRNHRYGLSSQLNSGQHGFLPLLDINWKILWQS